MGNTAAEGEPHLKTGCEGLLLPLQPASGDTQHNKKYGSAKMNWAAYCLCDTYLLCSTVGFICLGVVLKHRRGTNKTLSILLNWKKSVTALQ